MKMKPETMAKYASAAWCVLARAAEKKTRMSYEDVGQEIGLPARSVGRALAPIYFYCNQTLLSSGAQLPPLTSIVPQRGRGITGSGYTPRKTLKEDQEDVFAFDWKTLGHPGIEALRSRALEIYEKGW